MQTTPPKKALLLRPTSYIILVILAFLVLLPNLGVYEFKNEESLRTLIAYEMQANADFIQPTYLGDDYFKKPPMYTWLTLASAQFTGWNELASRIPSISAFLLTCLFLFFFTYSLNKNFTLAALSSLLYATTLEVLFFYGFVGEIDGTFTFAVFATMASLILAFEKQQFIWLLVGGFFTTVAFMLKGFPAFIFFSATLFILFFWYKQYSLLKSPLLYLACLLCFALPAIWLLSNDDPLVSFTTLFIESANRTKESLDLGALISHFLLFPFELLVKFLPGSLFLLLPIILAFYKKPNKYLQSGTARIDPRLKLLLLICLINFIPYWISVGARVRYILPLLPLLSITAAYFLLQLGSPLLQKRFAQVAIGIIALRLLVGLIVIPLAMSQRDISNSDKAVAMDLLATAGLETKKVACDCTERKAVCLYINIEQQRVLKKSHIDPDWETLISCQKNSEFQLIKEYPTKKHPVLLYQKALPTS